MYKPVFVALLALSTLVLGEGSGETLSDLEDIDGLEDEAEASGDWDLLNPVVDSSKFNYDVKVTSNDQGTATPNKSKGTEVDKLEYYEDVYPKDYEEFLKNYADEEEEDGEDYQYTNAVDNSEDSVLKIEDTAVENDIEIRPKPPGSEATEEAVLETSQIFIMVGSAFISFAIFMVTFFLCKRMVARKQTKKQRIPFTVSAEKKTLKESSIVKDYKKVPTTTKEFLQNPHIEMYREELGNPENLASAPLVK